MLSFHYMEKKFGPAIAYQCLAEIEKAARISSWQFGDIDPEIRLINAIRVQDTVAFEANLFLAA